MNTHHADAQAVHDAAESLRHINHRAAGELSISDLYSIVGSLDRLLNTLPQTLSTIARHVEQLADDARLAHDGSPGDGDATRTAAERAIAAAMHIDRALADQRALSRAHSELSTLKRGR